MAMPRSGRAFLMAAGPVNAASMREQDAGRKDPAQQHGKASYCDILPYHFDNIVIP